MKNKITLLVSMLFILAIGSLNAQVKFQAESNGVFVGTTTIEVDKEFLMHINNVASPAEEIFLSWSLISNDFPSSPSNWEYSLCDNVLCYNTIPVGTTDMDTIPIGGYGFFKIILFPHMIANGVMKLAVWETGFPATADTVEFQLSVTPVSVKENKKVLNAFSLYPNPAHDQLSLNMSDASNSIKNVFVYDILGNQVMQLSAASKVDFNRINVGHLPKGVYLVKLQDRDGMIYSRRLSIVH